MRGDCSPTGKDTPSPRRIAIVFCFFLQIKKFNRAVRISTLCHTGSDGQTEDAHNGVHGLVLPSDRAASVCVVVPETRARRVQASTRLLQHDDRDDVLERLIERGQPLEALLHDVRGPLVHLVVLVHVDSDGCGWVGGEEDRTWGERKS